MKKLLSICLAGIILISFAACNSTTPAKETDTAVQEPVVLKEGETTDFDELNTLSTLENDIVTIKLLSSAQLNESGLPMLDDSNEFAVVASVGDKDFVLLEKEMIQLGVPKVSLFEDSDGKTVITVSDIRTAKYDIFEYTYDESLGGFIVVSLTENDKINFIGQM